MKKSSPKSFEVSPHNIIVVPPPGPRGAIIQTISSPTAEKSKAVGKKSLSHHFCSSISGKLVPSQLLARGALRVVSKSSSYLRPTGMSYGGTSLGSGMNAGTRVGFEFGRTHVVRPKGKHEATVVWLHGLGDNGGSWSQLLETISLPNIKWICPTAPARPVKIFGGFPCTAWFDVGDLSEDGPDDVEGMDASAAHVANLLSTEPSDIKLGIGGFSMGAATALYSAICCVHGKYGNGNSYPANLSAVVGLSGWLPCSRSLKNKLESSQDASQRAAALPLLLCHGKEDEVVLYKHGDKSAEVLRSSGFQNLTFKTYKGLGHHTIPEEMDDVSKWLMTSLGLSGSSS